jgi:hypothetical protein
MKFCSSRNHSFNENLKGGTDGLYLEGDVIMNNFQSNLKQVGSSKYYFRSKLQNFMELQIFTAMPAM